MNVLTKIESDHQEIRHLIEQINTHIDDITVRGNTYDKLKTLVLTHHQAEQDTLLTELVQHDQSRDKAMHLVEEHGEHKKIIEQLEDLTPERADWRERYQELQHDLLHHIKEEEQELFQVARETLDARTLHEVGEKMVLAAAADSGH
jgi:hemerythrin-like domain-containing protein